MIVSPLVETDRPRWTELWRDYLAFYETTMPEIQYDYTWSRIMAGMIHGLTAQIDGHPIGLVHFLYHESGWTMAPVCYLQDLYVDPAARGTGAGRALIEACAAEARAQGSTKLYWLTQSDNVPGRHLYDRLAAHSGFIRYEYPM